MKHVKKALATSSKNVDVQSQQSGFFHLKRKGKLYKYPVTKGYGYFIDKFKTASNQFDVMDIVHPGLTLSDIEPVVKYLEINNSKVAEALSVSKMTVSRLDDGSTIGLTGSLQFYKIDLLISKGVTLFGSIEVLKQWLNNVNVILSNRKPVDLLTDPIGVEIIDEAIDALHFGNHM